jgi:hypothetical protein
MGRIAKRLANLEDNDDSSFAENIYDLYAGKTVEIYLGEKSGSLFYSDFDVEQKVYVTGKIVGALGKLLLIECTIQTPKKVFVKEVSVNAWAITGVMEKSTNDTVHISHIFQEMKR